MSTRPSVMCWQFFRSCGWIKVQGKGRARIRASGFAQNPVHLRAAGGADPLCHASAVLLDDYSGEVTFFTALHAVRLPGVTLLGHRVLLASGGAPGDRRPGTFRTVRLARRVGGASNTVVSACRGGRIWGEIAPWPVRRRGRRPGGREGRAGIEIAGAPKSRFRRSPSPCERRTVIPGAPSDRTYWPVHRSVNGRWPCPVDSPVDVMGTTWRGSVDSCG